MRKYSKWLFIAALSITLGTVLYFVLRTTVRDLLNRSFPEISYLDIQKMSLHQNQLALTRISSPDISLTISSKDFSFLVDSALTQISRNNSVPISHITKYGFSNIETSIGKQLINLAMDFDIALDTLNAKLAGKFSGNISFAVKNDSLILMPAVKTLHIDRFTYKKANRSDKNILVGFLNGVLKMFMNNINAYIYSKVKGIDIKLLDRKITDIDIVNNEKLKVTLSNPLIISVKNDNITCMIDELGIHILGEFNGDFGVGPSVQPKSFEKEFIKFQQDFIAKNKSTFSAIDNLDKTFFVISRKSISSILNMTLNHEIINATYIDTIIPQPINKELIIKSSDIDCSKLNFKCPQIELIKCPDPPIQNCDFDCPGFELHPDYGPCRAREVACRLLFQSDWSVWNTTCKALQAPIIGKNIELQAHCASLKAPALATCMGIKTSINAAGGSVDFGNLRIDASCTLNATLTISNFAISDDLSIVNIKVASTAIMPFNIDSRFISKPAGKLICPFNKHYPLPGIGTSLINESVIKAKISYTKSNDSTMMIIFNVNPINIKTSVSPIPFNAINGALFTVFDCSVLSKEILGKTVGASLNISKGLLDVLNGNEHSKIEKLILEGKYEITTPTYPIPLPIKCKPFKLFDKSIKLKPIVEDTYIGFSNY